MFSLFPRPLWLRYLSVWFCSVDSPNGFASVGVLTLKPPCDTPFK
jgi:hypothetical protein